jgi:hypothetical protein
MNGKRYMHGDVQKEGQDIKITTVPGDFYISEGTSSNVGPVFAR